MLDIKRIRMNAKEVKEALEKRHGSFPIDEVIDMDENRRKLLMEVEEMKARQNSVSKDIPKLKKEGKDVSEVLKEMKDLSESAKEIDVKVKEIDEKLKEPVPVRGKIPTTCSSYQ